MRFATRAALACVVVAATAAVGQAKSGDIEFTIAIVSSWCCFASPLFLWLTVVIVLSVKYRRRGSNHTPEDRP